MAKCIILLISATFLNASLLACSGSGSDIVETSNTISPEAVGGLDNLNPALAVYLEMEDDSETDYTKSPLRVSGVVSHPQAIVEVNGTPTEVDENGRFSSEVFLSAGSNSIQAIATYADMKDEWTILIGVSPKGTLLHVPGLGSGWHRYDSKVLYEDLIEIQAGETKSFDIALENGKPHSGPGPAEFSYTISRVAEEYSKQPIPMPEGMEISIDPSNFTAYPNTTYVSTLTIRTEAELPAGTYHFRLQSHLEGGFDSGGWFIVEVF